MRLKMVVPKKNWELKKKVLESPPPPPPTPSKKKKKKILDLPLVEHHEGNTAKNFVTKFTLHRIRIGSCGLNICPFMNSAVKNKNKILEWF